VKILDFGISRATWTMVPRERRMESDVRHLSPEQVQDGTVDARSDLFSFGTVLWELLTGATLFDASSARLALDGVLRGSIPSPRSVNPEVPPYLDDLTMRCLVRDPDRRIASASDLQLELHRIQRMLGAVIGSRALSSYLEDLFPDQGEARDVRQEVSSEGDRLHQPPSEVPRTDSLVDAAAELAEPQNPPAAAVSDPGAFRRGSPPWVVGLAPEPALDATPSGISNLAGIAGVLGTGHHLGDEVEISPLPRFRPRRDSVVLIPASSEEVTARPTQPEREMYEEDVSSTLDFLRNAARSQALTEAEAESEAELPAEDPSVTDLIEPVGDVEEEDTETGERSPPLEQLAATAPPELEPDPATLAEEAEEAEPRSGVELAGEAGAGSPESKIADQSLGEKKRFVAAALLLEGGREMTQEAIALVTDIAYKLDGIVHERSDSQVTVLFGLPAADENDVVAAVRFGLDAREAVAHLVLRPVDERAEATRSAPQVSVRVGIRVGKARMGGLPSREGYVILGNTLSEAAALVHHAQPGEILVSGAATPLATLHYALREVRPLQRHGQSVRCHRVVAPRVPTRRRKSASGAPLIGRDVEIRALRTAWRECLLRGLQRTVLITGEAGIGKSRLLDEFVSGHATDARAVAAAGTPHRRGTPYAVLVDILRGVAGVWSASGPRSHGRLLASLRDTLSEAEPQSFETLELLLGPRTGVVPEIGEGFSRHRVQQAMRNLFNRLATTRPTVVVVEDLQWADRASIECLKFLVEHAGDAAGPILFLMTSRPAEGIAPRNIFEDESASFILLDELDDRDRQRLIIEELGERALPAVVAEVVRRAGGNPFYIRELTRALTELPMSAPAEVPPTVQGVVASRVDRLPAQVKRVLQQAAVIGPTFREGILGKLVGRNPARSLALLRNRGIIVPSLRTAAPVTTGTGLSEQFEREWAFRHVLIQEVVLEALSSSARRALHLRVGEIIVKRLSRGSSDSPAEVARHLELGGQGRFASTFYLRSADDAAAAFASREALELYSSALRLTEGDPEHEYQILAGRERVCAQLGLHGQQAADLAAMRVLCGDNPGRLADLRNREAVHLLRLGDFYRVLATAEEAEAAASRARDELARGEALRLRGEAYARLNDHARATDAVSRALSIFEEQRATPNQVRARIALGRISIRQAKYDQAFEQYGPALELIKQTGDQWHERVLRTDLAVVHYCRGDFGKALDEALYSLKLCEQLGDRAREGDNATVIGIVYLALGMYDLARRYLEDAVQIHRETESQWGEAETLVYAGTLEGAEKRYAIALRSIEGARAIAERISAKYIAVSARNAIAWVLCERNGAGDATRARTEATEAAELARGAGLIVGEIPALSRSARASALLGDLDAARALSRRAVELLDQQRIIESSEEEILYTHFRIISSTGDPSARYFLEQAHNGLMSKMARLESEEWRDAFAARVRLNSALRRDYLRVNSSSP
jgi:adenylate cyclase